MGREIKTIVSKLHYLECPRWHEGRIWFADFYSHTVFSANEDGSDLRIEAELRQPSGLGWLPDGRLLVVSMLDLRLLRREDDGSLVTHAELGSYVSGYPNDMVVDAQGRAFVGHLGFDVFAGESLTTASLLRVDPDGSVHEVAQDLWFPNGSVITDNGVLLVGETFGNRVSAFDINDNGTLSDRRTWAQFGELPTETDLHAAIGQLSVGPDGCCLDAEGALWIADALGGRLVRVLPGGEISEEIAVDLGVFACMLGGEDGRTLFVCAAPDFDETARSRAREAKLLAVRVDVPHAGRP